MFYEGFEAEMARFAQAHYGLVPEDSPPADFAPAARAEPHFEFDAFGSVCLVRRRNDGAPASPHATALFQRAQILYREIARRLATQGDGLHDYKALARLFNDEQLLAPMDRREREFIYRTRSASVSADLIAQALGGVAPLPILQAVIGAVGDEISVSIRDQRENRRLGHLMIVVHESLPFPSVAFTLFGVKAKLVDQQGDFDCLKASKKDIRFKYDQQTWMLVDPAMFTPDTAMAEVERLAKRMLTHGANVLPAGAAEDYDAPPPEEAEARTVLTDALDDIAKTLDPMVEEEPEEIDPMQGGFAPAADFSAVRWPSKDTNAPDYAYLADVTAPDRFELDGKAVRRLLEANSYAPTTRSGAIAIALRGAQLVDPHEQEMQKRIALEVTRPNHREFRCVLGFYFPDKDRVTLYTGSTVPCRKAIHGFANGGDRSNMLPTGMYSYYIWRHKTLKPALRLSAGNGSTAELEGGAWATVLRSDNDTIFGTKDKFDRSQPFDNVHCAYFISENASLGAAFSSWGCLTIRGTKAPSHQWAKFQATLAGIGNTSRVDLMLATGKEAALAAEGKTGPLRALRQGSQGDDVQRLQKALGMRASGYFGALTADRLTGAERRANEAAGLGPTATGILTPEIAARLGWNIFT
jgi:hypothetical protein